MIGPIMILVVYLVVPGVTRFVYALLSKIGYRFRSPSLGFAFGILTSQGRVVANFMSVLVVLVAIVISNGSFRASIEDSLDELFPATYPQLKSEILLRTSESDFSEHHELVPELEEISGVISVLPATVSIAYVDGSAEGPQPFPVLVIDEEAVGASDPFTGPGLPEGDRIAISVDLATRFALGSGDRISVEKDGRIPELIVGYVFHRFPQNYLSMANSAVADKYLTGDLGPPGIFLTVQDPYSSELLAALGEVASEHGYEVRSLVDPLRLEQEQRIDDMANLLLALILLTLILGIMIVFLTFRAFVGSQAAELTKLRVIGATIGLQRRVIAAEWFGLLVTGLILSVPVGIAISWAAVSVLNSSRIHPITWVLPWGWIASVVLGGFMIGVFSVTLFSRYGAQNPTATLKAG
jgi:hypothetical protein